MAAISRDLISSNQSIRPNKSPITQSQSSSRRPMGKSPSLGATPKQTKAGKGTTVSRNGGKAPRASSYKFSNNEKSR